MRIIAPSPDWDIRIQGRAVRMHSAEVADEIALEVGVEAVSILRSDLHRPLYGQFSPVHAIAIDTVSPDQRIVSPAHLS